MKLTLVLDGKKVDFYSRGLNAGASLQAYDLLGEIDEKAGSEALFGKEQREALLRFIVELFGGEFSEQEFLEGCEDSFFNVVPAMLRSVVSGVAAKVQSFPNVPAGGTEKA